MKQRKKYELTIVLGKATKRRRMQRRTAYRLHMDLMRKTARKMAAELAMKAINGELMPEIEAAMLLSLIDPKALKVSING